MTKIKFDINIIKFMNLFESLTHAKVKDCIVEEERIIFIVEENNISKAVGRQGVNVRRLENSLKKKIKIVEHHPELLKFVQNVIYPLKVREIKEEEGVVVITAPDTTTRGYLIGRGAANLRGFESIVKRYFDIKEMKVL